MLWPCGFLGEGTAGAFFGLAKFGTILTAVSDNHVLFGWSFSNCF
jgi:hypothetical protein